MSINIFQKNKKLSILFFNEELIERYPQKVKINKKTVNLLKKNFRKTPGRSRIYKKNKKRVFK